LKRKRAAEERKRRQLEEAERLRKLEEERTIREEKEQERMRREAEKMEEMEKEKSRRVEEQQRRLAESMQRAAEERERALQEETERLGREEIDRQKKRCRDVLQQETDAALKNQARWYYEGGNTDWHKDRRHSARAELPLPALQQDATDADPSLRSGGRQSPHGVNTLDTKPAARRAKRRQKSPAKKSEPKVSDAAGEPGSDCLSADVIAEHLDMDVPTTIDAAAAAEN